MRDEGWISIHRKIQKHWIYEDAERFRAWITIIMECNHQDKKVLIDGELVECKRGQSLNSVKTWVKLFGRYWSRQKVRTFFSALEGDSIINQQGTRKTTILTVLNYDTYQTEPTNRKPTDNQQITTNNNKDIYRDFVWLKKEEYEKLIIKLGSEKTTDMINRLNNYIGSKGKKYKSHYHTILSWVAKDEKDNIPERLKEFPL